MQRFLVAQLSDLHVGATWLPADPLARLHLAIDEIARLSRQPDTFVITGDLAECGTDQEYETIKEALDTLKAPLLVLPGNHDRRAALRRQFELPGEGDAPIRYATDCGPMRILACDTTRPDEAAGQFDAEHLAWLDYQLGREPERPTIIAQHHFPLSLDNRAWDAIGLPGTDQLALANLIRRHPQIVLVITGHIHRSAFGAIGGCGVRAAPSTFGQAAPDVGADKVEIVSGACGYALHSFAPGSLLTQVRFVAD